MACNKTQHSVSKDNGGPMPKMTAAEYFAHAIALSGKSQKDIAKAAGYGNPNIVSMMKTGITKIPIDKAPSLARACGVDPQVMLRVVMEEYHPEIWEILAGTLGETITLSADERMLIARHRAVTASSPAAQPRAPAIRSA